MILGIDIDDTITNTYDSLSTYAQEYTISELHRQPDYKSVDCKTHRYTKSMMHWNDEEEHNFFIKYYEKVIGEVKTKFLASKYLQKLKDEGHKIVLITARFRLDEVFDVEELTKRYIKENNIPCDKLIIDAQDKGKIAREENIDIFIDDSYKNCKDVLKEGIKVYMMDSRVNCSLPEDEEVERVYSWPQVYSKIKEINQ